MIFKYVGNKIKTKIKSQKLMLGHCDSSAAPLLWLLEITTLNNIKCFLCMSLKSIRLNATILL